VGPGTFLATDTLQDEHYLTGVTGSLTTWLSRLHLISVGHSLLAFSLSGGLSSSLPRHQTHHKRLDFGIIIVLISDYYRSISSLLRLRDTLIDYLPPNYAPSHRFPLLAQANDACSGKPEQSRYLSAATAHHGGSSRPRVALNE
jgi:hypothetical protein